MVSLLKDKLITFTHDINKENGQGGNHAPELINGNILVPLDLYANRASTTNDWIFSDKTHPVRDHPSSSTDIKAREPSHEKAVRR